jgi:DNA invertase Pin-like site-specific DNA recombinase
MCVNPPPNKSLTIRSPRGSNMDWLVEPRRLRWATDRVLVIDDDLGKSGVSAVGRMGFQQLVSEVSLDHVGIIFGVEMSRLARSVP